MNSSNCTKFIIAKVFNEILQNLNIKIRTGQDSVSLDYYCRHTTSTYFNSFILV